MLIKFTVQGLLIYVTLAAFVLAASLLQTRRRDWGRGFWFAGFVFALASLAFRGIHTGHAPMQNLFEFFLCMAAALWPLSRLSLRFGRDTAFQDSILGAVILFPAAFVFSEEPRMLPPALQSPLFVPHVACYVAGYIMLARAALIALPLWKKRDEAADRVSSQTAAIGFLLITCGLLLGALWGKICWSRYWQWDPKEMWSLATWFVYAAYFHYRLRNGLGHPRALAALQLLGLAMIILTLTWINLSRLFPGAHTYAF